MKHKHYDIIVAWAAGAKIQVVHGLVWEDSPFPAWITDAIYRIKPEVKPDVVQYACIEKNAFHIEPVESTTKNVKMVFDGETNKLKYVELIARVVK